LYVYSLCVADMYSLQSFTSFIHYTFIGLRQGYDDKESSKGGRDAGSTGENTDYSILL